MNRSLSLFGLIGAGAGLAAGFLLMRRNHESRALPDADEQALVPSRRERLRGLLHRGKATTQDEPSYVADAEAQSRTQRIGRALVGNPNPATSKLLAGAGGGALAAWGAARGGMLGTAAGFTGAALLSRYAMKKHH